MQAFVRTRLQTGVKRGGFSEVRMGVGKRADSPSPSGVTPPGPPGLGGSVLMKFAPRQPISR